MADTFLTIVSPSEGIYKEKMSKFLAFAHPAASAADAKAIIASYQKRYHDARHVCWAYMIGTARSEFQCNDNGEPSGTAGKPILGQINSFNLTNIVIVVVRYFGGIKLGTGGLAQAYKEAAKEALSAAEITESHEMAEIRFTFPYMSMNDVMKSVKDPEVKIVSQKFDNACEMAVTIRADYAEALSARLLDIDGVTLAD